MNFLFNKYLTKEVPSALINIYRILFCAAIAGEVFLGRSSIVSRALTNDRFPVNCIFEWLNVSALGEQGLYTLVSLLILFLLMSSIGILTRFSLFAAMTCFFFVLGETISHRSSMNQDYMPWNHCIVIFNLLILWVAPKISCYSADNLVGRLYKKKNLFIEENVTVNWPIFLLQFNIVMSYFASAIVKLKNENFWANGFTLQKYLIGRYLVLDIDHGLWLAQHFSILVLLSLGTLIIELLFPLTLVYKKFSFFAVTASLIIQAYFYIFIELRWMHYYGWSYLIYLIGFIYYLSQSKKQTVYTYSR